VVETSTQILYGPFREPVLLDTQDLYTILTHSSRVVLLLEWLILAIKKYNYCEYPGLEADHSLSTRAEVKKTWACTCILPYVFME
jgi:hypothetical protein